MTVSLADLPDIEFADTDTATIEQGIITYYESVSGKKLYPGDPVRLFLEALAAIIAQQRIIIDTTGKRELVRFADGDFLDHLGALTLTGRLAAANAVSTVRFTVAAALSFAVPIPAGTRVSPDGTILFSTTAYAEIAAGTLYADVPVRCDSEGAIGNGFVPGQVNRMVDVIPYVTTVANTTVSTGGADSEADDSYRERIHLAPEKFSVAGPTGAYEYWAKSAHQDIIDVAVYSPAAGEVNIRPLMTGGVLPTGEIISLVDSAVNDRSVRPLTDQVTVEAPDAVDYDLTLSYYISTDNATLATQIQAAVQAAVSGYVLWQRSAIGRDINPSELIRRVQNAGAKRVEVASPAFQALPLWQVAQDNTVTITYGGLEAN